MLIDQQISNINQDGELLINLRPHLDVQIKIGTWNQGLPFFSKKNGQWVKNRYQSRIALITDEHINNISLPINQYLEKIPHWIVQKSKNYHYRQFNLLQILSKHSSAVDLFKSSPNLLWLLVIEKENKQWSDEKVEKLLRQKRRLIVNSLFSPLEEISNQLKFINKFQLHDSSKQEYELIKHALSSSEIIQAFNHWQTLPIHILALVQTYPKFLGCCFFEETHKNKSSNLAHYLGEYRETSQIILDIERMAQILKINNFERTYKKAKTKQSILNYHDHLVEQINKSPVLATEYQIGFPEMPLKGTANIVYIKNAYELKTEGHVMAHCASSYIKTARHGVSYFYKVLKPQRATLQIGLMGNNYEIKQFKLKSNREPSDESWRLVRQWLKEAKGES